MSVNRLNLVPMGSEDFVNVLIDGVDLAQPIVGAQRAIRLPYVFTDDCLSWSLVNSREPTVFDDVYRGGDRQREGILFVCGCGITACSCTMAWVTTRGTQLILSRFSVRDASVLDVGPFTFDRAQYFAEVDRIHASLPR